MAMSVWCSLWVLYNIVLISFGQNDICREGTYGNNCQLTCPEQCRPLQTFPCDKDTGKCSEGCNNGYHGDTCDKKCSCDSGICYQINGECYGTDATTERYTTIMTNNDMAAATTTVNNCDCDGEETTWRTVAIFLIIFIFVLVCAGVLAFLHVYIRFRKQKKYQREEVTLLQEEACVGTKQGERKTTNSHDHQPSNCETNQSSDKPKQSTEIEEMKQKMEKLDKEKRSAESELEKITPRLSSYEYQERELQRILGLPLNSTNHVVNGRKANPNNWIQCPHLNFDKGTVNVKLAQIDDKMTLWNIPDPRNPENNSTRFQTFQGATCTEPLVKTGFNQYFEAIFDIDLKQQVEGGVDIMQLGFVKEVDRDQSPLIELKKKNCFVVKVVSSKKYQKIILLTKKDGKNEHLQDLMNNIQDSTTQVNIGVHLNKDMKEIEVYDCRERKLLHKTSINIGERIWPMIGVCAEKEATLKVEIKAGRDIAMTKEKKDMIRSKIKIERESNANKTLAKKSEKL